MKYDCSECGAERPYFMNVGNDKLLEIPGQWEWIDTPCFYDFASGIIAPRPVDPQVVESIWKEEFKWNV